MTVRMWEVVSAPGRLAELLDWVLAAAAPGAAVYRSADDRIVVVDPAGGEPGRPPPGLAARDPHAWDFDRVPRPTG